MICSTKRGIQREKSNNRIIDDEKKNLLEIDQEDFLNAKESPESDSGNQRRARRGKTNNQAPEKTVIEETESEDDQHEPQYPRRGGLRGTQSTSSIVSTVSSTTTRTRSRSSQNSINANSSQGTDAFLSPQAKGKASQWQENLGRVTRSTSKEIVQTNSKPVGRRRKIL